MSTDIYSAPLWNIVSKSGLKAIVVNVPISYPPIGHTNETIISGLHAPSLASNFVYPLEAKNQVIASGYKIDVSKVESRSEFSKATEETLAARLRLIRSLMRSEYFDLFAAVLVETDRIQHQFMVDPGLRNVAIENPYEHILRIYKEIDLFIADLLKENYDLIIVSDHGFHPVRKVFAINEWLRSRGLLGINPFLFHMKRTASSFFQSKATKRLLNAFQRKAFSDSGEYVPYLRYAMIPSRTHAWNFSHDQSFGFIALNQKSREPEGILSKDECQQIAKQIKAGLLSLKDPETGRNIISQVHLSSDIYHGEMSNLAPDLVVEPCPEYAISVGLDEPIFGEITVGSKIGSIAEHDLNGIFIFCGPSIKHDSEFKTYSILDIAPTALYMLGLAIPSNMDGRVLKEISSIGGAIKSETYVVPNQIEMPEAPLSKEDERLVEERLRTLGYM